MVRYLAAIACLAILGVSAAASFADLRPDARLHPAPWVLTWQAGMPNTFRLTGEDGAHLRLGSRAIGIGEIGAVGQSGAIEVLGSAEGCPGSAYTAEDPGQAVWLPAGSTVQLVLCGGRPADLEPEDYSVALYTHSGQDVGQKIVSYQLVATDSPPVFTAPERRSVASAPGQPSIETFIAEDPDGDAVSYTKSGNGEIYLTLGLTSGELSVTDTAPLGVYNLTITATANGLSMSIEFTVEVR